MQLHIDSRLHDTSSASSMAPLPAASDATLATITALMLRRTKIKNARQGDALTPLINVQAAKGYSASRSEGERL